MIQTIQTAFASGTGAAVPLPLPRPTVIGNRLVVNVRFNPLTGTPSLSDSFANAYKLTASTVLPGGVGLATFAADVARGGANHTVTATAQGGDQTIEVTAAEESIVGPTGKGAYDVDDLLWALLAQSSSQTALLNRITTALRG